MIKRLLNNTWQKAIAFLLRKRLTLGWFTLAQETYNIQRFFFTLLKTSEFNVTYARIFWLDFF